MRDMVRQAIGSAEGWAAVRFPETNWRFARESGTGDTFILQPWQGPSIQLRESDELPESGQALQTHQSRTVSREEHLGSINAALEVLKRGELQKVVLSRTILVKLKDPDWSQILHELDQRYPDAYVFVVNHPELGCWMGASPERLLLKKVSSLETMALAGTRLTQELAHMPWTGKEVEEQDLVRKHIVSTALDLGATTIDVTGPLDKAAGSLSHLCSVIEFNLDQPIATVARALHPTPAVSGLPAEKAKTWITRLEYQSRGMYAGYMGWTDNKAGSELFVMLRCMQCWRDGATLFVGGGITSSSEPEQEFIETENKAGTLKSILQL